MKIRIKIGTLPATYMFAFRKKYLPSVGDTINVKHNNVSFENAERVVIDDIKIINGEVLFFAYRM